MKSASRLHTVSRGLLAVMALAAVIAFCPCLTDRDMAMDDCCQPSGLSIAGMCCVRAEGQPVAISSKPLTISIAAPAFLASVVIAPVSVVLLNPAVATLRPVVARTILRI